MDTPLKFVVPAEGRRARAESGAIIDAAGAWLPDSTYLRRRLKDGDLVKATPPVEPKRAKPASKDSKE